MDRVVGPPMSRRDVLLAGLAALAPGAVRYANQRTQENLRNIGAELGRRAQRAYDRWRTPLPEERSRKQRRVQGPTKQPIMSYRRQPRRMKWGHIKNCVEFKSNDGNVNQQIGTTSGEAVSVISGIAEGTGHDERVGTRAFVSSIDVKLWLTSDTSTPDDHCDFARVMLVQDKQANGATSLTIGDLLDTASAYDKTTAFRNLENTQRFKVLYDKRFKLSSYTTAGPNCQSVNIHKKFPGGLRVTYDTSDTAGTSIKSNDVWLVFVANHATEANNPYVAGTYRVRYTD
jgi:hypothetical protein